MMAPTRCWTALLALLSVLLWACTTPTTKPPIEELDQEPTDHELDPIEHGELELDPTDLCETYISQRPEQSLDGSWTALTAIRNAGAAWPSPSELGEVQVPGWLFPFERFPNADKDAYIEYSRSLPWPSEWDCAQGQSDWQTLVEFDSADYFASVFLDDTLVGEHEGHVGRFALPIPMATQGTLRVRLEDQVRDVAARCGMEAFPHSTLQGADTGGWGVNPVGLPGSVRLRMVRGFYLRDAYVTLLESEGDKSKLRVGLRVERLGDEEQVSAELHLLADDGQELAFHDQSLTLDEQGEQRFEWELPLLETVAVGSHTEYQLQIELRSRWGFADQRSIPLVPRQLGLQPDSLTVNGERHFARGAAVHHQYRFLPFDDGFEVGRYVALDEAMIARGNDALSQAEEVGVQWLRMGHLMPDAAFLRSMRQRGMMVYQDFPLHWNTDYEVLSEEKIEQQFRDFLWRVAAEPAVGLIAIHNEAEFEESDAEELQRTQALIERLLAIARQSAPHLLVIGCSGCTGSAQFPGNPEYPVSDSIADVHSYFGSWWQPTDGYLELPELVERLLSRSSQPILWGEMGNGWTRHYVYLCGLVDELEPSAAPAAALRAELEAWLKAPDGTPLSLRQWYAMVYCYKDLGVELSALQACTLEQAAQRSDAEVIAWARSRFMADRALIASSAVDPIEQGVLVAAHWLAAQIFESRWQWGLGQPFLGVFSWERGENRYPFAFTFSENELLPPTAHFNSARILGAANARLAASLRWLESGELELRVVNDGDFASLVVEIRIDGSSLRNEPLNVPMAGVAQLRAPAMAFEGRSGARVLVELREGLQIVASSEIMVP